MDAMKFLESSPTKAEPVNAEVFLRPKRTFTEDALSFLTMGHLFPKEGPTDEVRFTPEGGMVKYDIPSGTPSVFEDPTVALSMGAVAGVRAAAGPVGKLITAGREALGWVTGGASEIPTLAKTGAKSIVKAIEAKPLAAAAEKRAAKGVFESITPEARISTDAIDFLAQKTEQVAPKVTAQATVQRTIPEPASAKSAQVEPPTPSPEPRLAGEATVTPTVEKMLASGEITTTATGRQTTAFPTVSTGTNRKTTNTVKKVDNWLVDNARTEARARGDEYNGQMFDNMDPKRLSPADKDSLNEYLFGTTQPSVQTPLTKPLSATVESAKVGEKAKEPWEMTKRDFENYYDPKKGTTSTEEITQRHSDLFDKLDSETKKVIGKPDNFDPGYHEGIVKQALSEGKPVPAEVLKDYPELGEKVEATGLDALTKHQSELAQRGSLGPGGARPRSEPAHTFESAETERLFQDAKGIKPEGIIEKIKNVATEIGHKSTRSYEHLANKKENAQLIFDLKRLEKQKEVVSDRTTRSIGEMLSGLGKPEYEVFSRKVILDDLMSDVKRGLYREKELPFKLTPESLAKEHGLLTLQAANNPKIEEALVKRRAVWDAIKKEYVEALTPYKAGVEDMFKENYYRHQVFDYIDSNGLFGTGKRLSSPTSRGYMKGREGYSGVYNTDFLEAEHQIMSQMFHDAEVAKTLTKIKTGEDIAQYVRANAKVQELADWHKAIPEGYTAWQPKQGNVFYPVMTVEEKTAERIMSGELDELIGEGKKIFGDALAIGGPRKEWVVRNEVAETLDNLTRERAKGIISKVDLGIMKRWKQWQLVSPRRFSKYNIRNLTGDADAAFLGNPSGFKKSLQAAKELGDVFYAKKPMPPDMAAWFERGGMNSTLQAQEMGAIKEGWMFARLHPGEKDLNLWNKYWRTVRKATDYRESVLRYANFLDFKEQIIKNGGKVKNYAASKPEMIDGLTNVDDKAYWLSNDLLGAYDMVSVAGQTIRERAIPFWSWQEVNAKRYIQLYKNAANDGRLAGTVGRKLGATTVMGAIKVGRLAIKTAAFASALAVYNHTVFPDEENRLPADIKQSPHVILGKDSSGNIQYFNRMGALDDFISWFGLDYAPRLVNDYLSGRKTLKEALKAQGEAAYKGPVNKVVQGAAPFLKTAGEIITQRSTFPDVFKPGTIRNRYLHIARSIGLENEYVLAAGLPSKGYGKSIKNLVMYSIAPGEAAYRTVYDRKSEFLKKMGRTSEGFWLTPTGDALYNMKLSLKYQDKEAFSKYFKEYVDLAQAQGKGADQIKQGIKSSILAMHPLYGMTPEIQKAFVVSLNKDDQDTLVEAIKFYGSTIAGEGSEKQVDR